MDTVEQIEIPDDFVPTKVTSREQYLLHRRMYEQLNSQALSEGENFKRESLRSALYDSFAHIERTQAQAQMYNSPLDGSCVDRSPIRIPGCMDHDD